MTNPPPDFIRRIWDDAMAKLDEQVLGDSPGPTVPRSYHDVPPEPPLAVHKYAAGMVVSDDVAMDLGLIPDTRPRVPIPWWRRLRWKVAEKREWFGRKVGGWIAGVDLAERDDW